MPSRTLPPTSRFAGDDGSPDPAVVAALAAHARGELDLPAVVAALAGSRVLVPVLPHDAPGEADDGCEHGASTGAVAVRGPDGRLVAPVFTGVAQLAAWRSDARPIPSEAPRAAAAALAEGWQLVVVDPAGPAPVELPRTAVHALAEGRPYLPALHRTPDGVPVVAPEVAAAIAGALTDVEHVVGVEVDPGTRAEVRVTVDLVAGLDRPALDRTVEDIGRALAAEHTVALRVESLELRPRPAG